MPCLKAGRNAPPPGWQDVLSLGRQDALPPGWHECPGSTISAAALPHTIPASVSLHLNVILIRS
eukprot:357944-Chlamydomonas_euryale.AAC.2